MSITTMPIDLLRPARSWRADSFGTQPSLVIAISTRSRVASLTSSGELTTLDTVPSDTRARAATSFMLIEALRATWSHSSPSWTGPRVRDPRRPASADAALDRRISSPHGQAGDRLLGPPPRPVLPGGTVFALVVRFDLLDPSAAERFDALVADLLPQIAAHEPGTLSYL